MKSIHNVAPVALFAIWPTCALASPAASAATEGNGTATVRVVIEPPLEGAHRFVFTGNPAGGLTVRPGRIGRLVVDPVAAGTHASTLVHADPDVEDAGYSLTAIRCDDSESARPSAGDLEQRRATLEVEAGESVTCDFVYTPTNATPEADT
jgi:hypothetical protein